MTHFRYGKVQVVFEKLRNDYHSGFEVENALRHDGRVIKVNGNKAAVLGATGGAKRAVVELIHDRTRLVLFAEPGTPLHLLTHLLRSMAVPMQEPNVGIEIENWTEQP